MSDQVVSAPRQSFEVVIANNASLSGAVDLGAASLAGILMPAAWTAAALSFAVSQTFEGTYAPMWSAFGAEYQIPSASAVAGQFIVMPIVDFMGIRFIKVRSGLAGAAVNQGGARTLTLIACP